MLLVHNSQTEAVELDALADEGVRSYHYVDAAICHACSDLSAANHAIQKLEGPGSSQAHHFIPMIRMQRVVKFWMSAHHYSMAQAMRCDARCACLARVGNYLSK